MPTRAALSLLLILALFAACAPSASPTPSPFTPTPSLAPNTPQPGEPTWTPSPIPFNPTATINFEAPNPVQISELQHVQLENRLVVAAKFQNTLQDAVLRDVQYEVLVLDANGSRLAQEFGAIPWLLPRQTSALVRAFDLLAGAEAASVELRFTGGAPDAKLKLQQPFTIADTAFIVDEASAQLSGWLSNADEVTYTEVSINAIAYNAKGEIVGGGSGYMEFVPSKDTLGVSVPATVTEAPTRVEIYPSLSAYSASLPGGKWWNNIKVEDWSFVTTSSGQLAGGAVLTNITDRVLTGTFYILTVSDAQGRVCLVAKDFINLILPGETLNFSPGVLHLPQTVVPSKVDLLIVPGEFGEYALAYNPLSTSQPLLDTEGESPLVRVNVLNNLNAGISTVLVSVLIKDPQGKIVGGGQILTERVPPNGSLRVAVPVAFLGDPETLTVTTSASLPASAIIGQ
ncbi:MAG: hypothetical protein AB2L16_00680 [Anaerolineaceae bacterium]